MSETVSSVLIIVLHEPYARFVYIYIQYDCNEKKCFFFLNAKRADNKMQSIKNYNQRKGDLKH